MKLKHFKELFQVEKIDLKLDKNKRFVGWVTIKGKELLIIQGKNFEQDSSEEDIHLYKHPEHKDCYVLSNKKGRDGMETKRTI